MRMDGPSLQVGWLSCWLPTREGWVQQGSGQPQGGAAPPFIGSVNGVRQPPGGVGSRAL